MNQEYPSLDGIAPSWADVKVTFSVFGDSAGAILQTIDIAGIKTGQKLEVGEQMGTSGGRVMRVTTGSSKNEASMTLYKSGARKLKKALVAVAPTRGNQKLISIPRFDILVQYTPPGESEIYVQKIKGCRYAGNDREMKEGNEADKEEIPLIVMEIVDIIDVEEVVLL